MSPLWWVNRLFWSYIDRWSLWINYFFFDLPKCLKFQFANSLYIEDFFISPWEGSRFHITLKIIYSSIWPPWVLVEAHTFFIMAHGIQFPDQGLNLSPLHWECGFVATAPPGKSSHITSYSVRHYVGTICSLDKVHAQAQQMQSILRYSHAKTIQHTHTIYHHHYHKS